MESKKINQLATAMSPSATDLTIIGDPVSGVSKKATLQQISSLFGSAVSFYTNLAAFPATGTVDTLYCAKDTYKLYIWSGSAYVQTFPSQTLLDTYQLKSEKGASNGYASLDSSGKVPISQLPSSIMEYKGMWNASTNTPTLANGTGDTGDVYICNVAGTVNFGAGAITFAVGDYVVYSGTIWQRSSGAVGTVTSVAVTETGDALTITGSPVTTSGTINIGFAGSAAQYVAGDGTLITFPSLTGYVPYTGATTDVDLGTHVLNAQSLHVKGTAGAGHLGLKHQTATPTGSANESLIFADVNGNLGWQNDNLYLSTFVSNANTANRTYTLQNASGTLAFLSDIPSLTGYVTLGTTQTITATKYFSAQQYFQTYPIITQSGIALDTRLSGTAASNHTTLCGNTNGLQINLQGGAYNNLNFADTANGYTYTFPAATGTIALTSDIPSLAGYVTLATTQTISGQKSFTSLLSANSFTDGYLTITGGTIDRSGSSVELQYAGNGPIRFFGSTLWPILFSSTTGLATFSNSIIASSFIKSGGTSSQYLMADGSTSTLTNPVTGTGTTNYLPKFTGTSTIGNSSIVDDGSIIKSYTNAFRVYQPDGTGAGFYMSGNASQASISSLTSTNTFQDLAISGATLTFLTTTAGSLGASLAMTINPSGNVSINNSNDTYKLDVSGTGRFTGALTVTNNVTIRPTSGYNAYFQTSGTSVRINYLNDALSANVAAAFRATDYSFQDGSGSSVLTIASTGAATFSSSVTTGGDIATTGSYIHNGNGSSPSFVMTNTLGNRYELYPDASAFRIYNRTTSTYPFSILNNGNVGIGTTTPNFAATGRTVLDINGTSNSMLCLSVSGTAGSYLYQASGNLNISNEVSGAIISYTGGSERMRITSGGLLLIGTTSSSGVDKVRVNNDGTTSYSTVNITNTNSTANFYLGVGGSSVANTSLRNNAYVWNAAASDLLFGTSDTERMRITSGGNIIVSSAGYIYANYTGTITNQDYAGAFAWDRLQLGNNGDNYIIGGHSVVGGNLTFVVNNTNRGGIPNGIKAMTLTSDGNVLIGKTSSNIDTGDGMRIDQDGSIFTSIAAGNATYYVRDITNSAYRFYVTAAGTINATNTTISAISDVRLKENITDLQIGLDAIMALRPRQFDWKKESGNNGKNVRGFIAQEFEEVFPDLIDESINKTPEGEPYKQIRQDLIPILVKAIQELKAEIDELKNK